MSIEFGANHLAKKISDTIRTCPLAIVSTSDMKLLVVDDHPVLREGVAEVLRQIGPNTEVLQARTAAEGLDLAACNPGLAAVVLDLNLPDSSGMQAIAQFAKFAPVMILSSSEDPRDVREALARGAMGYVTNLSVPRRWVRRFNWFYRATSTYRR